LAIYELDGVRPELPAEGEYWIAPNAVVLGRVRLKKGASIWFGAVLRGDNDWIEIGENSNVQDNSVFHTDLGAPLTIGDDVTIGHAVTLHGCTIGNGCIIGMGSTILNRADVGARSIVGAHALLPEDKAYPERSLILGVPARVVREIPEEQAKALTLSSASYVANSQRYMRGLKQIG